MKTRKQLLLYLLVLPFLCLSGGGKCETVDRIAAIVNNKVITLSEVMNEARLKADKKGDFKPDIRQLKQTLDQMINDLLLDEELTKRGLELSDSELDGYIKNIMKQNRMKTYDELSSALALQGMSMPEYRKNLKKQIERSKLMSYAVRAKIDLSDQDLKNYYVRHLDEAREPDALHLKDIFISKNQKNESSKKLAARSVLERLNKGESFDSLVKSQSEDSNAKSGGDLGFLTIKDLNKKIYDEVAKIKSGQHTGIIETGGGFYIIKLVETRRGEIRNFESVKEELKSKLTAKEMESKFLSWLSDLKSQSYIEIKI